MMRRENDFVIKARGFVMRIQVYVMARGFRGRVYMCLAYTRILNYMRLPKSCLSFSQ
jgi:hypothetical protein